MCYVIKDPDVKGNFHGIALKSLKSFQKFSKNATLENPQKPLALSVFSGFYALWGKQIILLPKPIA